MICSFLKHFTSPRQSLKPTLKAKHEWFCRNDFIQHGFIMRKNSNAHSNGVKYRASLTFKTSASLYSRKIQVLAYILLFSFSAEDQLQGVINCANRTPPLNWNLMCLCVV